MDRRGRTKLAPKRPGFIAQEIAFLKRITTRKIKATLPAPALLGERMWHPEKSAKAYPKREDFVRDCVPILRRELELIRRPVRTSSRSTTRIFACSSIPPCARSMRMPTPPPISPWTWSSHVDGGKGAKLAVHLCRRAGARARGEAQFQGGYDPIIDQLNRLKVHHLTMEFTTPG